MSVIEINNLTRDYGNNKGIFDVSFSVEKGEVVSFLGPNGAGKTTTIRHLLGFMKAKEGNASINGLDCFKNSSIISSSLGYLPGENVFMEEMKGNEFIKFIGKMHKVKDFSYAMQLEEYFELDSNMKIKKMSKGMKQKIAIICAFMTNPDTLILDEPTSGLDPLMQEKFVRLILNEKKKGKTILMSSHIFEEIEKTCDRAVIIKDGRIIATEDMKTLNRTKAKRYIITFRTNEHAKLFAKCYKTEVSNNNTVIINGAKNANQMIKVLSKLDVINFETKKQSLEDLFMHFYKGDNSND